MEETKTNEEKDDSISKKLEGPFVLDLQSNNVKRDTMVSLYVGTCILCGNNKFLRSATNKCKNCDPCFRYY